MKVHGCVLPLLGLLAACAATSEPPANSSPTRTANAPIAATNAAAPAKAPATEDAACPKSTPAVGSACQLPPPGPAVKEGTLGYCSYPAVKGGGEQVCYCQNQKWSCYDQPPTELPGAPKAP